MPYRGPVTYTTRAIIWNKIRRRKEEIDRNYRISNITPITDIALWETPEFLSPQQAMKKAKFRPVSVGEQWGGGGVNGWFRLRFAVPGSFAGREVAAFLDFGGEGCAFLDGKPFQGVDGNHQELLLLKKAKGGEEFEILVDVNSIHWHSPHDPAKRPFQRAALATRNPEVEDYFFNLDTLHLLAQELPEESTRAARIVYHLNRSVDAFDYTHTDDASLKKSAVRANKLLKPVLDSPAEPSATTVAVHGHSHIDVAWLWPYRETRRKCARTFSTVMRLMEQYPEYIFTQSQAQLYQFVKENHPTLYEEIRKRVKEGRWDVTGSMWVEADCNLSSGESLVRQILLGKNFYRDEFGIDTDVLWLPDVFGYAAALPQILQKAGVPYFSTIKINWSQFNTFPYNTFRWVGIDGTSVLAHFPPTTDYNAFPIPSKLRQQVSEFKEKDRCDESLLSYGWGDGGGGPDRRHLEYLRRSRDLEGLPRCEQKKVTDFFHSIDDASIDYPSWVGELYLELHRGTYTTQARNKMLNRRAEFLYRDAELLSSIAEPLGLKYPYEALNRKWQDILCNQFHDVIPGSSIRLVYEDTEQMYPEVFRVGEDAVASAVDRIAGRIDTSGEGDALVVFNTLPWDRSDVVKVAVGDGARVAVTAADGTELPVQPCEDGVLVSVAAPSMGYSTYRLHQRRSAAAGTDVKATRNTLENRYYRVRLDSKGAISSLLHKTSGRELVPAGDRANTLRLYEDKPNDWPAWDIDFFYEDKYEEVSEEPSTVAVLEQGPVRATVQVERKFSASRMRQTITAYADSPRIDFRTWVDWHEKDKVLKACFPVDVNASRARYEIQFGNVERPTHTNTSWDMARFEVCAHKWADISEEGFGMSLMNDCKYGHHTTGNEMRLTLLRSPKEPDPEADMGEHEFTYSIMPHSGDYISAGTVREAYGLNVPMRAVMATSSAGKLPGETSFFAVDAENVVLETVKRAEKENSMILRLYECHNRRAEVHLTANVPFTKVFECGLMEDNIAEIPTSGGSFSFEVKPFEIRTFKLVP